MAKLPLSFFFFFFPTSQASFCEAGLLFFSLLVRPQNLIDWELTRSSSVVLSIFSDTEEGGWKEAKKAANTQKNSWSSVAEGQAVFFFSSFSFVFPCLMTLTLWEKRKKISQRNRVITRMAFSGQAGQGSSGEKFGSELRGVFFVLLYGKGKFPKRPIRVLFVCPILDYTWERLSPLSFSPFFVGDSRCTERWSGNVLVLIVQRKSSLAW